MNHRPSPPEGFYILEPGTEPELGDKIYLFGDWYLVYHDKMIDSIYYRYTVGIDTVLCRREDLAYFVRMSKQKVCDNRS